MPRDLDLGDWAKALEQLGVNRLALQGRVELDGEGGAHVELPNDAHYHRPGRGAGGRVL
ncbi:hypothetical protein [Streptomyces sp. H27-S2]|uniref:hypothetical protein n=1 Tax=Streptomyces antarcticus TaxID=2996458 RepID=UPI00226F7E25|nr:hypothetical protein [Streptomyces sp. H27-S2]MCY0954786.1 hypothetical protein [Streptomyces sp. H27-S2]